MKKTYTKPFVVASENLSEGVYLASGDGCYTTTATIHQVPETGRSDYRIQVNATHHADHTKEAQTFTITFNQPVNYSEFYANGAHLISGNGTNTLVIGLTYHQNPTDKIGAGDLVVTSQAGLAIVSCSMTD